ncbi:hypothetical protein HY643_05080 [Candidatus Woesearchaeota archaeon]|nr:hypothetical protein [Candidatus Woesearchaeota archaeon]
MGFWGVTKKIGKGVAKFGVACLLVYGAYKVVRYTTKPTWNYDSMAFQAAKIADNHPLYGNCNGELDLAEKKEICRETGINLPKDQHIPYSALEKYVELYTK